MRIAFYAPMKPPDHTVPSGDRRIGRLMMQALARQGHAVRIASRFRSYEGRGDAAAQAALQAEGETLAAKLLAGRLGRQPPDAWFTYHLHHKAPDWLGPPISAALGIPYIVAEAAYAPRRGGTYWPRGLAAVAAALRRADAVLCLNPNDEICVRPLARRGAVVPLAPFLDRAPFAAAAAARTRHRRTLAARFALPLLDGPDEVPWLLAVGMMRDGDKLDSYRVLAAALRALPAMPWRLLIAGDGPARRAVTAEFAPFGRRVRWLGALPERALPPLYAASDVLVWPAMNEAIGMAILEAQAAGLPAVVGDAGAVATIVADGRTGRVVPVGDAAAFAAALAGLLADAPLRDRQRAAALAATARRHDIAAAALRLDDVLHRAVQRGAGRRARAQPPSGQQ